MGSRKKLIQPCGGIAATKISVDHTLISFFLLLKIRNGGVIYLCHLTTIMAQMLRRDCVAKK